MLGMFGVATGPIWLALVLNSFRLPAKVALIGYGLHAALSTVAALYFWGLARTIRQRRLFVRFFGANFYPDIENIGQHATAQTRSCLRRGVGARRGGTKSGRFSRLLELGEPIQMWAAVPLVALFADVALGSTSLEQEARKLHACAAGWNWLFEASDAPGGDRAKYLIDRLDCDAIETFAPAREGRLKPDQ
jgi:hypothetical protein